MCIDLCSSVEGSTEGKPKRVMVDPDAGAGMLQKSVMFGECNNILRSTGEKSFTDKQGILPLSANNGRNADPAQEILGSIHPREFICPQRPGAEGAYELPIQILMGKVSVLTLSFVAEQCGG